MDQTTESRINELVPALQPLARDFLAKAREQGFDLKITEGYRSNERQAELYAQGRTKPGKIVTNAKPGESLHNQRRAFDVYDNQKGYNIDWEKLARLGESLGLVAGRRFPKLVDNPHFEYLGPETILQAVPVAQIEALPDGEALFRLLYGYGCEPFLNRHPKIEDEDHAVGVWKTEYARRDPRECVTAIIQKQYGGELAPILSPSTYELISGTFYRKVN